VLYPFASRLTVAKLLLDTPDAIARLTRVMDTSRSASKKEGSANVFKRAADALEVARAPASCAVHKLLPGCGRT